MICCGRTRPSSRREHLGGRGREHHQADARPLPAHRAPRPRRALPRARADDAAARRDRGDGRAFGGKASALAWLEAENQVLLKIVALAASAGHNAHTWQLPVALWTYHNVCGHWHDGARLHRTALAAAERCGDLSGQAFALRGLGSFAMSVGTSPRRTSACRRPSPPSPRSATTSGWPGPT